MNWHELVRRVIIGTILMFVTVFMALQVLYERLGIKTSDEFALFLFYLSILALLYWAWLGLKVKDK
jgi:uncharacterized protein with PQ loop repeat